jgi:hypothetical protein
MAGPPDRRRIEPWQDPKAQPYVRIDKVTKKFGDVYAVDNVSLDIFQGELFSLLGGSGCGKSTLLRMLAGLEQPTVGRIYIDGVDVTQVPPYSRPVNMMFQSYALFPHMSVEQNVEFGLKQEKMPRAERAERVADGRGRRMTEGAGHVVAFERHLEAQTFEHPGDEPGPARAARFVRRPTPEHEPDAALVVAFAGHGLDGREVIADPGTELQVPVRHDAPRGSPQPRLEG